MLSRACLSQIYILEAKRNLLEHCNVVTIDWLPFQAIFAKSMPICRRHMYGSFRSSERFLADLIRWISTAKSLWMFSIETGKPSGADMKLPL